MLMKRKSLLFIFAIAFAPIFISAQAPTHYWLNYPDALQMRNPNGQLVTMPMWPDSTVQVTSAGNPNFYWFLHGYTQVFDPISGYLADWMDDLSLIHI